MKKLTLLVLVFAILLCSFGTRTTYTEIDDVEGTYKKHPVIVIDNTIIDFEGLLPEIFEEKTFAPARKIVEFLGMEMNWDAKTSILKVYKGSKFIQLNYKNNKITSSMMTKPLSINLVFKYKTAYIPLAIFANEFGFEISSARDHEGWPVIRCKTLNQKNIEYINLPKLLKDRMQQHKKLVIQKVTEMKNSYEPKFYRSVLIIKKDEKIGKRLRLYVEDSFNQDFKVFWSKDNKDGTFMWEQSSLNVNEHCPSDYSWDVGQYLISARVDNGSISKIISIVVKVVPAYEKKVYLTFDDGPNVNTKYLLDVLKNYSVDATFFMILNQYTADFSEVIKRTSQEGHKIANHGANHNPKKAYASKTSIVESMNLSNDYMQKILGFKSFLCRTPYGSTYYMNIEQFQNLKQAGYLIWDWNVESGDSASTRVDPDVIVSRTIDGLKKQNESIILFHDKTDTTNALPQILNYLTSNNYDFQTISETMLPQNFAQNNIKVN